MMINAVSPSFSASIDDVLNYATRFRKQYGFIVVVVDHMNEEQNDIADVASQLYLVLKKSVRITDTIFRFFQDSWVICLDNCDDHLLEWTQYILQSILQRRSAQMLNLLEGALTFIHGFFLQENTLAEAMQAFECEIQSAKNSLRQLKTMRSTALISGDSLSSHPINFIPLIHQAILDNRLFLAFQPVVDSQSRKLHYYECLARILDKKGRILSAGSFISQCEKIGIIPLIDQKVQQLAIEELMNDRHLQLAINVSAITASDPQWLLTFKAQMTARPDLRERLMVELTETSVFQNIDESIQFITQLRDLGCQVSIDDFGAGYMSLVHLKSDLVQAVKIDARFVKNLKPDSHNIQFIRAIMALTQHQGIKCIAEGVEDAQTAAILGEEQVDCLQGYYIGKPSHFRKWL
jgi:EAL domain-containing protein (putative c-di-GMP-specific phosphodiesterase class I)